MDSFFFDITTEFYLMAVTHLHVETKITEP